MSPEGILEDGLMLDPKSKKMASLREMVVQLCSEAENHQIMSDFYRGEVKRVKDLRSLVRRKLARISKLIRFWE
ncbi:hypothetical protein AMTR_s00011p00161470 [Amborella trichopoda]|uniref:Uncharacterized protein n=1 Tax=Amborella trichopoda TaxID=13333 RepID=W1NGM3_AMBTC|nr:hypothetical protein AMTR_s00011p00161470 [Amborella trichopoda]